MIIASNILLVQSGCRESKDSVKCDGICSTNAFNKTECVIRALVILPNTTFEASLPRVSNNAIHSNNVINGACVFNDYAYQPKQ